MSSTKVLQMPQVLNEAAELAVKIGELIQDDVSCWELEQQFCTESGLSLAWMRVTSREGKSFTLQLLELRE